MCPNIDTVKTAQLKGRGEKGVGRKTALFFEDIAGPGNDANHVSIKPLLETLLSRTFFVLMHARVQNANRDRFCA